MKRNIVIIAIAFGLITWNCTKTDTPPRGLKQAISKSAADINTALSKISASKGYQLLSSSGITAKSGEVFNDSITLGLVAGIYDYQPDTIHRYPHFGYPFRLFKKTGTSDMMIVNLPQRLIFHPKYLHYLNMADTALKNDFTITASAYHLYYNWWKDLDYKLTAGLTLNSEDIGSLDVAASASSPRTQSYSSKFTFTDGYNISTSWQSGDTATSSFALMKDDNVLLKESNIFIGTDFHKREKQYILTIGNIDIKRIKGVDSIQVYLDGVLQKEAAAVITDSADTTGSICHNRDILLTFDDGTTAKLSELINPALTELRTLINSLHDMYFAKNIVDYIAINIYYNSR